MMKRRERIFYVFIDPTNPTEFIGSEALSLKKAKGRVAIALGIKRKELRLAPEFHDEEELSEDIA